MTSIDMGGTAIFDDSAATDKGWTHNYTHADNPNGGWIFNNTTVTAGGDVMLGGVGFTNSTVNVTSGNLSIVNTGPVLLNGSDVSASGDVVLSSVNDTVNINNTGSKRTSVISIHGNITVKANPGTAGSGYSISLNGADLQSSEGYVDITGINTGSGNSGGVYLNNTSINADGSITINGSALFGLYSGVFLGDSVNLTASGNDAVIDITGHSTGQEYLYSRGNSGVYLFGRESTLSAANINISGYNPNLKNSVGILIGHGDIMVGQRGASFTFNGNTSLYGDGGRFGIDLGIGYANSANSLIFNNGNVSITGIQRGPRDVVGSGGISAQSILVYGNILQSITNITTSNVGNFTIYGITKIGNSLVPGIGSSGLAGVAAQASNNIKLNFSGQVGRLNINGEANSGSGVNTQVFNAGSLNATDGISIQGESKSGTGVVLSAGDYSKNEVNIIGKSTSGNAVRLDNNISLTNANISGTSGTGSGVVFSGATHNLTNVEVTGQTEGTSGSGILISGLDGDNVSMQGTSNGSRGTGISLSGSVLLSGNSLLNGISPTGTGLNVGGKVEVAEGSTGSLTGTSTTGRGVLVDGNTQLNNATVSGNATEGSGIEVKGNLTNTNTTLDGNATGHGAGVNIGGNITGGAIKGESASGSGVLVSGTNTTVDGATISGNTSSGVGVNISGSLTNTNGTTVNGSAADGSGVTLGGNLSGGEVTGTSQTGSGVNITGDNSVADNTTLKGSSTSGTGVTISGNLTNTN
ncbi:beta strand repeat-containing protein, partial [Salmonella enterica]